MCGIIGILGKTDTVPAMLGALKRLEYRGYDSAGVAVLDDGQIKRRREIGKLQALMNSVGDDPIAGTSGIGHTRWATHGEPTTKNAHPHITSRVAVVHNGIIENFRDLRDELKNLGIICEGESDTEVITKLLDHYLQDGMDPVTAFKAMISRVTGAYALAVLMSGEKDLMLGARRGSPLVIGLGDGEMFFGSDALALADLTNRLIYMEEGDLAVLSHSKAEIYDKNDTLVQRKISFSHISGALIDRGNHRHFMQKEIYEQPTVVAQTLGRYLNPNTGTIALPAMDFSLANISKITLVACGTSYYAALVAKYWIEQYAHVSVDVDIASEFRYRNPVYAQGGLCLFISQSGETADTLAALRHAKDAGQHVGVIVNAAESSMAREAALVMHTHAGPEIGVASTKAFTCQLAVLAAFTVALGVERSVIETSRSRALVAELESAPTLISKILSDHDPIISMADKLASARDILFVGRGIQYPIALEGALKLKELSYIHAEGYAAGELKHGPIALIDEHVPVIGIAPKGEISKKTISNLQEIAARKGNVILVSDDISLSTEFKGAFIMPTAGQFIEPLVYAIPVQLIAYYTAVAKGTDVDQPRNLAKAVTVE